MPDKTDPKRKPVRLSTMLVRYSLSKMLLHLTYAPLNAPTGLRTATGATTGGVSRRRGDTENLRPARGACRAEVRRAERNIGEDMRWFCLQNL
jgi:hypothetical protein